MVEDAQVRGWNDTGLHPPKEHREKRCHWLRRVGRDGINEYAMLAWVTSLGSVYWDDFGTTAHKSPTQIFDDGWRYLAPCVPPVEAKEKSAIPAPPNIGQWMRTDEQMPEEGQLLWVYGSSVGRVAPARFRAAGERYIFDDGDNQLRIESTPTFWMPRDIEKYPQKKSPKAHFLSSLSELIADDMTNCAVHSSAGLVEDLSEGGWRAFKQTGQNTITLNISGPKSGKSAAKTPEQISQEIWGGPYTCPPSTAIMLERIENRIVAMEKQLAARLETENAEHAACVNSIHRLEAIEWRFQDRHRGADGAMRSAANTGAMVLFQSPIHLPP